ncbi:MAG: hypothetical protein HC838_07520 [Spirulinaceae cyanobacterium RM2_2_10]|nr:hypothetical protein [Spirulinaceae cyanobacterium RM2_2_10]
MSQPRVNPSTQFGSQNIAQSNLCHRRGVNSWLWASCAGIEVLATMTQSGCRTQLL